MTNDAALARARMSLEGLSVGDATGECMFAFGEARGGPRVIERAAPWPWTDDTAMALSIVEALAARGELDPDDLAARFSHRYWAEPARGYGAGAHRVLSAICEGTAWRAAARDLFGGEGSLGNGAAMRAAPIGAYFAGELDRAATEARRSAAPTHAHPEGAAGAIAVAVLAAHVFAGGRQPDELFAAMLARIPAGEVARGVARAALLGAGADPLQVAAEVGNGARVTAADTVPFAVWCAVAHLNDYAAGVWACGAVGGDVDTTAAMVGGIVVGAVGLEGLPTAWREAREPLP